MALLGGNRSMELLGRELWLVLGGFRQCRIETPTESMPSSVGCLLSIHMLTTAQ